MDAFLPAQPETYKQLIRRSVVLYRASFKKVMLFAFLLSITVFIPRLLSDFIGQDIFLNLPPFSPHKLWLTLINFVGLIFFIAIIWHMHCVIINLHEPMLQDLQIALKKLFNVIIAGFIQSLILAGAVVIAYGMQILIPTIYQWLGHNTLSLFIISLIFFADFFLILYVATLFIFLVPLIAIENKSIISALERSVRLVWNHWLRTFTVQMTPWLAYLIFLALLRFIFRLNIHIYFASHAAPSLWVTLLQLIIFALFIPWVASVMLVQLKDLELRKHITA